ncbi:hypothetical protein [Absidia glauca]|uniref:HMG box domain-containing protein n=1 Tax=Absidia glauca TaxID=4829 RepID=A0A163LPH6_ABSGL|nr:hypothetical protein [Absidia glauca]
MSKRKRNDYSDKNEELVDIFEDIANSFHRLSAFFKANRSFQFGGPPTQSLDSVRPRKRNPRTPQHTPNAPRPYVESYSHFIAEQRPLLRKSRPGTSAEDIVSILNARWRKMADNEKKKYEEMYLQDRDRYRRELNEMAQPTVLLKDPDATASDTDESTHDQGAANSESTDSEFDEIDMDAEDEVSATDAPLGVDFFSAFGSAFGPAFGPAFGAPSNDPQAEMQIQGSSSAHSGVGVDGDSDSDALDELEMDDSEGSSDE